MVVSYPSEERRCSGSGIDAESSFTSSFPRIVVEGGDDRVLLNSKGVNKYFCPATPAPESLFRGSCTCNIPTENAYRAAEAAHFSLLSAEVFVCFTFCHPQYLST